MEHFDAFEQNIIHLALRIGSTAELGFGNQSGSYSNRSKDIQYAADTACERLIQATARCWWRTRPNVAFFTEDQGLITASRFNRSDPTTYVVIDPIDGSRFWANGQRQATSSVVVAYVDEPNETPRLRHVNFAFLHMLNGNPAVLYAWKRNKGVFKLEFDGQKRQVSRSEDLFTSQKVDLKESLIRFEGCGLLSSVRDAGIPRFFSEIGAERHLERMAASRALFLVAQGTLDAMVDIRARITARGDHASLSAQYLTPLDISAALMILLSQGGKVTDAWGNPLDEYPLIRHQEEQRENFSIIAAGNPELWGTIFEKIQEDEVLLP